MNSVKRVVKNTLFLYIKMLVTICIALFSTRLVLEALGVVDYGVYNLVGGVIALLAFLNSAMTVSTQRYLSVNIGTGNSSKISQVFKTSIRLHLIIGIFIVILLELVGLFIFDGFLNIPSDRLETAKIIYHLMVVSTFFTINAVPYDASINANEHLVFDSILGIIESFVKLVIAVYLITYEKDRLLLYVILLTLLIILVRVIKSIYCFMKFEECSFRARGTGVSRVLFKEMFSFARWNMFGSLAAIGRNQGIAVILNIFFGAAINASFAIANQVSAQLSSFSAMMLKAVNPQIMKKEGANARSSMLNLAMTSSKISFFLLAFFAIPLLFLMPDVLKLWLKDVPDGTVIFCNLILISTMINQLTIGLQSAFQAVGKIKLYQFTVGSLLILNLPISYLLLNYGLPAYSVFFSFISIDILAGCFRVILSIKISGLLISEYLHKVLIPSLVSIVPTIALSSLVFCFIEKSFIFYILIFLSIIIFIVSIIIFGLNKYEKYKIISLYSSIINKK
ncbi:Na+-driven multidrug efflux pump [Polaribacter sp. KT25b]|uniref:lipopolysaccharide biosynthesis protein n=1 Tax=Polaribacter sp. KT25b TaxID=1855336 RepID=UPI00087D3226|nr:hypothetical protein [Polaribacter sp. KT25b]SDS26805.1 Na+-driven multidrug efflux pump [Polaribacter sp. KT25b]